MSLYAHVPTAPADPILGIADLVKADLRPDKANLGIGVYQDAAGKLPLFACVREAERRLADAGVPRGYLAMDGDPVFAGLARELVFGTDAAVVAEGRVVTVQTLAGTGALKIGATFLRATFPDATVMFSDPTWDNHEAVFGGAGFVTGRYRYYDPATRGVAADAMLDDLCHAAPGTIVVLHACCHNPTGCDLTADEWRAVLETMGRRGLVAFIDMAYQGFATSLEADPEPIRLALAEGVDCLVASSFSKNLGLYGERVGALSLVCADAAEADRVRSQVKLAVRANYSNPPTHGAALVRTVLGDPELRASWTRELAGMRDRIGAMRVALAERLVAAGVDDDVSFITTQRGMFSFSGLSPAQMETLRRDWGVYGVDNGRLCVAALNERNLDHVASALAAVWHA